MTLNEVSVEYIPSFTFVSNYWNSEYYSISCICTIKCNQVRVALYSEHAFPFTTISRYESAIGVSEL